MSQKWKVFPRVSVLPICVYICLGFLFSSISETVLKTRKQSLFNTSRLPAYLHVRVRLDSINERTNKKKILLTQQCVCLCGHVHLEFEKAKPHFRSQAVKLPLCNFTGKHKLQKIFQNKQQAVTSGITEVCDGHILHPRWGTTEPGIHFLFYFF